MQVLNHQGFEKRVLHNAAKNYSAQLKRKEFISIQKLAIMKAENDGMAKGMAKGIEKGIEKGIQKGIQKGIEKMVVEMRANQIPVATIAKITKLPEDKIKNIIEASTSV